MANPIATLLSFLFLLAATTYAAESFAASNLYYAAGLTDDQQETLLSGLQSANIKVLRVWLDGQFAELRKRE